MAAVSGQQGQPALEQAQQQTNRPRIYYGWWMVVITSWMAFFASGIFFRGFTVFVPAIRDSLNISQAQTNLIFSLARAEGGLEGPFAGWLIDKFGNRNLLIPSVLLAVIGYFALSQFVSGFWSFALVYLGLVSLGNSIAFQHAMFAGINQWFRRRRSLAISILAAVSSLGGLFIVPSMNGVIEKWGWEMGSLLAGAAYLVFLLPLCFVFRNKPEDMGLLPDGDTAPPSTAGRGAAARRRVLRDYTVPEALRTQAYWLLMLGAGLRMIATLGILVSIIPILEDKGVSRQMAANLTGAMFGINFLARLVLGYFGDKWSKSLLLAGTLAAEAVALVFLYFGSWDAGAVGIILITAFIVLEGFGDGAGIIVWAALGDYYGRDRFATLRGYITFSHSWALVASPVYVGWVFDHFGNYDWAILPAAVAAGLASLCFLVVRRPPQLTTADEAPPAIIQ
ncbi:MAG: MFS transporter [Chloroflexota bacterium]|nr:MFS transporter [Chloroflexota bacterium]